MAHRSKQLFLKLILILFSMVFSVFLAETICSHIPSLQIPKGHHELFCEYDPLLGWRKKPNVSALHKTHEYSTREQMNSKGIRGPEYSYSKDEDEYRILILGDSFAEGYTVEFKDIFSEVLKDELISKGVRCQVINAGTAGYSTDQELLFFQSEGKKYHPDLVIVMFYENDVWYNNQPKYWRGNKPIFKHSNGRLVLSNVPVALPEISGMTKSLRVKDRQTLFGNIKEDLYNRSCFYRLLVRAKNKVAHRIVPAQKATSENIPEEFMIWQKTTSPAFDEAWNITGSLILRLREETTADGSRLLVFLCPLSASIYSEEWESTKQKYGLSDNDWSIEQAGIRLEAFCARNQIDFIDPTPFFKAEADKLKSEHKRLYYVIDNHWNYYGHKLTGKILADFIDSSYLSKEPFRK